MKRCWCFFLLVAAWCCPAVLAAPKSSKGLVLPPGHRFLFVVDTSAASAPLSHATRQAVVDMIWSGLDGQIRQRDTYGLWTYNEEPRTGIFPMQTWTNTVSLELASQAGKFLRDQPYANKPRLDRLIEKLRTVISAVKDVDILIVSGGEGIMTNTPFDSQINAAWRDRLSSVREGKKPLITTLAARKGEIASWSVSLAGDPIHLAARPTPPAIAPRSTTNATPRAAVTTSAPPVSIIIEKPRPAAATGDPLSTNVAAVSVAPSVISQTSVAAPTSDVPAVTPNADMPKAGFALPPVALEASSIPAPRSAETPAPVATKTATPTPQPESLPPSLNPSPLSEDSASERLGATADARPLRLKPPGPTTVAAREAAAPERSASTPPPVTTDLMAVVPRPLFNPVTMAMIGSALLLTSLALILLFVRRSAPIPPPSFITQSIERAERPR